METINNLLLHLDPFLILPYRFFSNPMIGWWAGTGVLALWSVLLGEFTAAFVYRVNRGPIRENWDRTAYYHEQSLKAKQCGDEKAYRGINKLANEAYGKSFFLFLAMGMASLWPAFFAAAWLQLRFADLTFSLPGWIGGFELNHLAPFILVYIAVRITASRVRRLIPFLNAPPGPEESRTSR